MSNRVRLILYKWREWAQSKKKQEQTLRIVRLHHQKSVLSKTLHEWRALTLKSKAENSRLLYESKMHAKTSELKNDYESQMEDVSIDTVIILRRMLLTFSPAGPRAAESTRTASRGE